MQPTRGPAAATPPGGSAGTRLRSLSILHVGGPVLAVAALALTWRGTPGSLALALVGLLLAASVLAAVHHAEVVAHRAGEPLGALILAVAVTVIEVGLIVTLMVSEAETATLARDTVFAAVMITTNGVLGLSLLAAARRQGVPAFRGEGTATALANVLALTALSLVMPRFTARDSGQELAPPQLAFAAASSLALYVLFVLVQTVRHRSYFLPRENPDGDGDEHAPPPSGRKALGSLALLLIALVCVVGLAKVESPAIEDAVTALGAPPSAVGVVIALLVLLPEAIAAVRNARRGRLQISFNLALGSGMASIGLTIPVIAVASIWLDDPLVLGLGDTQIVLLATTAVVGTLTVLPGRATLQEAGIHLVLLAAFLFFAIRP